jgi:hypothetical protein
MRSARRPLASLLLAAALAGCVQAPDYQPPVDLAGVDPARYAVDLSDCRKAAELDRFGPLFADALIGAELGVGLGAVGGWATWTNVARASGYGAAAGAVAGAVVGATQVPPPAREAPAIDDCLRANGYRLGS